MLVSQAKYLVWQHMLQHFAVDVLSVWRLFLANAWLLTRSSILAELSYNLKYYIMMYTWRWMSEYNFFLKSKKQQKQNLCLSLCFKTKTFRPFFFTKTKKSTKFIKLLWKWKLVKFWNETLGPNSTTHCKTGNHLAFYIFVWF